MRTLEKRINILENITGLTNKYPLKIIFEVISENGTIIKTNEIIYRSTYEKNARTTEKD